MKFRGHTKMIHIATLLIKANCVFLAVLLYAFIGFFKQPTYKSTGPRQLHRNCFFVVNLI